MFFNFVTERMTARGGGGGSNKAEGILYLCRCVRLWSGDQRTPAYPQSVTEQGPHGPGPQQHGQVRRFPQLEDAGPGPPRGPLLQDNGARGPGPGVEVRH